MCSYIKEGSILVRNESLISGVLFFLLTFRDREKRRWLLRDAGRRQFLIIREVCALSWHLKKAVYCPPQLSLNAKLAPAHPQSASTWPTLPSSSLFLHLSELYSWTETLDGMSFSCLWKPMGLKHKIPDLLFINNNAVICVSLPRDWQDTFHKSELLRTSKIIKQFQIPCLKLFFVWKLCILIFYIFP